MTPARARPRGPAGGRPGRVGWTGMTGSWTGGTPCDRVRGAAQLGRQVRRGAGSVWVGPAWSWRWRRRRGSVGVPGDRGRALRVLRRHLSGQPRHARDYANLLRGPRGGVLVGLPAGLCFGSARRILRWVCQPSHGVDHRRSREPTSSARPCRHRARDDRPRSTRPAGRAVEAVRSCCARIAEVKQALRGALDGRGGSALDLACELDSLERVQDRLDRYLIAWSRSSATSRASRSTTTACPSETVPT